MDELAKKFTELADKYGPAVIGATQDAVRVEALSTLVFNVFGIAAACALSLIAWRRIRKSEDYVYSYEFLYCFAYALMFVAAIITFFLVFSIIDPCTWVAIYKPELWIAKKVFHL